MEEGKGNTRVAQGRNKPSIRFPEFEGEWVVKKVGELCDFIVPGRNKPTEFHGDIPWITTPDIDHNGIIYSSKKELAITKEEAKKLGSKVVPKHSIVISCVGELGLVAIAGVDLVINQQLHAFLPQRIEYRFLLYSIGNQKKYMERVATRTAVPYMNKDNCNSIPISFPCLSEQTKIASFFTAVDQKIQALKKKKTLLEEYKKAAMQKIFSQEIRFKQEDGADFPDWESRILGEMLDYEQPANYLVSSTEYDDKFKTPVVTAGKTFILGYTDEIHGIFKDLLPVIIFDDFTTATQFVDFPFKAKSSAMKILKARKSINIKFIYEAMQMIVYETGGHGRHWISVFSNMEIETPCFDEQVLIADFLSTIDEKINKTDAMTKKMESWKKGLLQQMFC